MKLQNSISIFAFTLLVSLYLFFISSISEINLIIKYGEIIAVITFSLSLIGLFILSLKIKRTYSYIYYILLFITSIIILVYRFIFNELSNIVKYYFVIAVLIALLLSLLDMKRYILSKSIIKKYKTEINEQNFEIRNLNHEILNQKEISQEYKKEIQIKNKEIKDLNEKENELQRNLDQNKREITKLNKEIEKLNETIENFKKRNKNLSSKTKQISEMSLEKEKLEKELKKKETEIKKQVDLKSKYSKTLSTIKRKRKEEEELLVVSSDGKSVHRPKCIAVRTVPKDNRKLIKNWNVAKKEGYDGCKLCKPHIKPEVIIRNGKKYKFLGANNSDKVHKASCILIKNISEKDRIYFKTYKEALKKKYTACRVCNPDQYQHT